MYSMLLALFAQSIVQDPAGDFIVARNQSPSGLFQPHFVSKFDQGGRRLAWTLLPPGGRGAMAKGPQGTFFYVNSSFVLQYAGDGRLMTQYELKLGCPGSVRAVRFTRRGQLLITGESSCVLAAVGTGFELAEAVGRNNSFTAEIEPRGGIVRWLLPRMGGWIVEEASDGSVLAASVNPVLLTRISEGAKTLLGQRNLFGVRNPESPLEVGPDFLRVLPDGGVAMAGTTDAKEYPSTPDSPASGAQCRPYIDSEPFDFYRCASAYFSVFTGNLDRVIYSSVLPNTSRLAGARLQGIQVELFAIRANTPAVGGACPKFAMRYLVGTAEPPTPLEMPLPSQFRAVQMWLPDDSTNYYFSPADGIDAVLTGDTAKPEPDFCIYSSLDGRPARKFVAGSYYTLFFMEPRPGARLTLNGKPPLVVYQSPTQLNFHVPFDYPGGVLALDGVPIDINLRDQRYPSIMVADPFSSGTPRQALVTDERGRLLTRENAAGPGDRVFVYSEGGAFAVIASTPDEYPVMYPIGLPRESIREVSGYPNLFVGVHRVPVGRPTDRPRRFYVGSPVGGGGPTREMEIWLRLQY